MGIVRLNSDKSCADHILLLISRGTEPFKLPYRRSGFRDHLDSSHVPEFFTRTMTPSKCASDQFILELLAQNLARQGGERKRKKEVDGKNMAIIEPSLKKNKAQLETVTDEYQKKAPKKKMSKLKPTFLLKLTTLLCVWFTTTLRMSPPSLLRSLQHLASSFRAQ